MRSSLTPRSSSARSARPSRRTVALAGATAALSICLSACGGSGTDSPALPGASGSAADSLAKDSPVAPASAITPGSTMERIKKAGVLRVGAALDAPLLSQQNPTKPDEVSGFDITLAKMLATYIIGKPSIKITPPASETREALLRNDSVDVVFNTYTITPERAKQIQFAGPYFMSGLAIATKKGTSGITGPKDLDGKTVIVGANTPAVEAVPKEAANAKVTPFATDPQAVQALLQGRGDAYVQDFILLATNAATNTQLEVVGKPFTEEPYGIGLPPDDADFKAFVNTWLTTIQDEGQWLKAYQETIGSHVEGEDPTPPRIGSVPGS